MTLKQWLFAFILGTILGVALFVAFNFLTDPFGVFGDKVLDEPSYNMTQNPRTAKIAYMDKHFNEYDSYIVGCSKTSSFPTEKLNEGFDGAKFYNMLMYGGDLFDVELTCRYLIENYQVKNLVVNMGLEELVYYNVESDPIKGQLHAKVDGSSIPLFYAKHLALNPSYGLSKLFSVPARNYLATTDFVFDVSTGVYDKRQRDIEPIGDLGSYLEKYPTFLSNKPNFTVLPQVDHCLESIKRIKDMCMANNITLTVVISPLFDSELDMYYCDDVRVFLRRLSQITPYWDFSGYTSVSAEARYFYDYAHFRNNVGYMMAAKMFGNDDDIYVPDDFGWYVTPGNIRERLIAYGGSEDRNIEQIIELPVLIYHHFVEPGEPTDAMKVTIDSFEAQIKALSENGYGAVDMLDLIAYVENGIELPEKPVLITFDDGYRSNITLAAPVLRKYGMKATVFVVGVSVGADTYKDTGVAITPHFTWEEALEYSDVINLQSHTYDLHRSQELDGDKYRFAAVPAPGEDDAAYVKLFSEDIIKLKSELESNMGTELVAFAYPHGATHDIAEVVLSENGIYATFGTEEGYNTIVKGLPQSLRALKRFSVYSSTTPESLLMMLEKPSNAQERTE